MGNIVYRKAKKHEWRECMALAWRTFLIFDAPDYSEEGIQNFRDFVEDEVLEEMFLQGEYHVIVALDENTIVGIISVRNENHISLLFVDKDYHGLGIGGELINCMGQFLLEALGRDIMTVNAAPYAVGFYHKLGFIDTGLQTATDGIIYTPMEKYL